MNSKTTSSNILALMEAEAGQFLTVQSRNLDIAQFPARQGQKGAISMEIEFCLAT